MLLGISREVYRRFASLTESFYNRADIGVLLNRR